MKIKTKAIQIKETGRWQIHVYKIDEWQLFGVSPRNDFASKKEADGIIEALIELYPIYEKDDPVDIGLIDKYKKRIEVIEITMNATSNKMQLLKLVTERNTLNNVIDDIITIREI